MKSVNPIQKYPHIILHYVTFSAFTYNATQWYFLCKLVLSLDFPIKFDKRFKVTQFYSHFNLLSCQLYNFTFIHFILISY